MPKKVYATININTEANKKLQDLAEGMGLTKIKIVDLIVNNVRLSDVIDYYDKERKCK